MQNDNRYNDADYREDDEQEIDLMELAGKLWKAKKQIIWWAIGGIVVGLIVAFSTPKEYTTEIKLAPEITDGKSLSSSGLGSLASMVGINLGSGGGMDAVNPTLYPEIVASVPFNTELFDVEVSTIDDEKVTIREYIEDRLTGPWWGAVLTLPGEAIGTLKSIFVEEDTTKLTTVDPFRLDQAQTKVVEALNLRIGADVDTKTAVITVSVKMQDPLVSALLADTVVAHLQQYVTEYRTNKARKDLEYAQRINDEAKQEYHKAQQRYASYIDRNQGISLRSRMTEEERMQNEMNLAFNLYNTTAQQLQLAKAKVQEITPVYTVIKPATVPIKGSPSKAIILIGFTFLAVVIACVWILYGKDFVKSLKNATKDEEKTEEKKD